MSFTKNTASTTNISDLPVQPTISAVALQALFDKFSADDVPFENSLIDELEASTSAGNLGATAITDLTGSTIQTILESIRDNLKSTTDGSSGANFVKVTAILGVTGAEIQTVLESLKALIDLVFTKAELESQTDGSSGMDIIGMTPIDGVMTTPQQSLEYLKQRVDGIITSEPTLNLFSVLDYNLVGDDITNDATALNTLLTLIGSNEATMLFPALTTGEAVYLISTNVVFPANVNVEFANGAKLKVSNTFSVTATNTKLTAGLYQIFDTSLGGTVEGSWNIDRAYSQWFGAVGDGLVDDTQAILDTLVYLSETGGILHFPAGTYKFTSQITVSDRINIYGVGMTEASKINAPLRPTRLLKDGEFDGIILGASCSLNDLSLDGETDNTGFGVQLNGNRSRLINVSVNEMGSHGVVVGDSLINGNRNYWRLINVTSRRNGGHGFLIDDYDPGTGPDANAGFAQQCNAFMNALDGWYLDNLAANTFTQCYAESNTGKGWNVKSNAGFNNFIGVGSEQNTGEQFEFESGSSNNLLIGAYNFTEVDNGANLAMHATGGAGQALLINRVIHSTRDGIKHNSNIAAGMTCSGTTPGFYLYETDAATDEKGLEILQSGGNLQIRGTTDTGGTPTNFLTMIRAALDITIWKLIGKVTASDGIGVGNSAAATTLGSVVKKMQIFDEDGNAIGYVPIYDNIT